MKRVILILILMIVATPAFSNARSQIEKVNLNTSGSKFDLNLSKEVQKDTKKIIDSSEMTNYQYEEQYIHYNKIQNAIKDNLEYSQSGKNKY